MPIYARNIRILLESNEIDPDDKEIFLHLKAGNGNQSETTLAFATLMRMMHKYYKRKVIFLLDEYDVPIAKASDHGYYDQMLNISKRDDEQFIKKIIQTLI